MGTNVRAEVSRKRAWWIGKERFYELQHFCRQYPEWRREYLSLDGLMSSGILEQRHDESPANPVEKCAEQRLYFRARMEMVENAAMSAGGDLGGMLLKAVTEGLSYEAVSPPCCREVWYTAYRRFFYLLDKVRG